MKTDRNITLKDGTNLTLKGGGVEQSRYEEEIKEIGIAEFFIRIVMLYGHIIVLIPVGISIFFPPLSLTLNIFAISMIILGLFGYFFVTESYPNMWVSISDIYEINNDKKKFVRYVFCKHELNITKKDKELNEALKCVYGLIAIIFVFVILMRTMVLHLLIYFYVFFLLFLVLIFHLRYVWKMPLNKPPEEEFPEWKYIVGHMSANKLILICLIISAVPVLVIYSLWKIFLYLVGIFF